MKSLTALGVAALFSVASSATIAQTATTSAKPAAKSTAVKPAAKPAGVETVQAANPVQLDIAKRVHTGKAACEFDQTVSVSPLANQPGYFSVGYKEASYTMVPEETTTGAVRLQDKKAGVVWLQIANKSMLMNSKIGQRMVDSCVHPEQRATADASKGAARAPLLQ
jgi:hypothetical protein